MPENVLANGDSATRIFRDRTSVLYAGASFVTTAAIIAAGGFLGTPAFVYLLLTPALLAGAEAWRRGGARPRALATGAVLAALVIFAGRAALVSSRNVMAPSEWDFQCFHLWGRAGAEQLDFYQPESLRTVAGDKAYSQEFRDTTIDAGFTSPPPTMLLLAPLGWFDRRIAAALWYVLNGTALVVDLLLLRRLFLPGSGWPGLAFIAALTVSLRATQATAAFAQTNFLVLLMVLLFWRDRERANGGLWLALGMTIKPWVALLALYPFVHRQWRTLAVMLATTVGLYALATIAFGADTVRSYFVLNPVSHLPPWVFREPENQSLSATLLRLVDDDTFARALFWAFGALGVAITAWIVARLPHDLDELGLIVCLVLAFLVYPGTLAHYSVLLLPPMTWLWARKEALGVPMAMAMAAITAIFTLVGAAHDLAFWAFLLTWGGGALLAIRSKRVSYASSAGSAASRAATGG